ncbi:MAG: cytochrome c [Sandarakinorhabdus sp.]|nr:cytochrome c [Sandarakinorhabdus sp.]
MRSNNGSIGLFPGNSTGSFVKYLAGNIRSLLVVGALVTGWPALAADAKATYLVRCSMCHQSAAQGLPGQFPRLAGRSAQIAQTPEGRHYLARVMLWGVYGPIEVDGTPINGLMPSMASMTDDDLSAVLNHVITQGKPAKAARPFKPAEIAAVRAEGKIAGSDNAELRRTLVASGVIK